MVHLEYCLVHYECQHDCREGGGLSVNFSDGGKEVIFAALQSDSTSSQLGDLVGAVRDIPRRARTISCCRASQAPAQYWARPLHWKPVPGQCPQPLLNCPSIFSTLVYREHIFSYVIELRLRSQTKEGYLFVILLKNSKISNSNSENNAKLRQNDYTC